MAALRTHDARNKGRSADCPICQGNYTATNQAAFVCHNHQNWVVTVCSGCKRTVFAPSPGGCKDCAQQALDEHFKQKGR